MVFQNTIRLDLGRDGNREIRFIGLDDKPLAGRDHVATHTTSYDPAGNITERRFFDSSGKPVLSTAGYAGWQSVYDERQREISRTYIGTDGAPLNVPDEGYATLKRLYDDRGRISEESYFDKSGAKRAEKFATVRAVYDARGSVMEETFFGADGKPSANLFEARVEHSLDRFGREIERRFFDAAGKLTINPHTGRAIVRFERDGSGHVLRELSLDASGQPVNRKDLGWYQVVRTYDKSGQESSKMCKRTNGGVLAKCRTDD